MGNKAVQLNRVPVQQHNTLRINGTQGRARGAVFTNEAALVWAGEAADG